MPKPKPKLAETTTKSKKEKKDKIKSTTRRLELLELEYKVREAQMKNEVDELLHATTVSGEVHQGIFRLYGDIDSTSMERLRTATGRYAAAYPGKPVTIIMSSPGGHLFDGWVLFDHLRALSANGHRIVIVVRGFAGSMAAVLLQAADERVIGPESYLVIHEAASMAWGKASEVKEESDLLIRFNRHTENVLARRSKLTPKEIRQRSYKKDWYVNAKECKKHGFVDRIG